MAYELADRMPIEIINMDSVQVYKYFDIGSAKPDLLIQKQFKHHLIDILEILQSYSVADYLVSLDVCIKKVRQRARYLYCWWDNVVFKCHISKWLTRRAYNR